ncbi:EamA family transporter [Terracoccus luteus]|uniref:Inner membrane transporter RhtA n=1 Tax=Terracoccus luteus TaxID=53356 RepID=A0A839PWR2_9MICO|nr:EamA family transporter [Terracoccus luteus]MBB2987759.1 inner membrane transporter RhtA [Terracoccus luteus]MCP2173410.1 inner membrane transporter RhtA [Terracoccus luteus]
MRADPRTAPLLVLGGVVSVQFGAALATTLIPRIGATGSVTLRLAISCVLLLLLVRPSVRGRSRAEWGTVVAFGLTLAAMNTAFYSSLAHLPIGVAVTVEFLGPLTLAAVRSRRALDLVAVLAAAGGVVLVSGALDASWSTLDRVGIGWGLLAGVLWAMYIVLSQRTGSSFDGVDGLALALLVSTVAVAPFGLASAGSWPWSWTLVATGVGIAVLSSVLPYSLELMALRHLSQRVFGVLLSLEPAVAAVAGLVVLGQVLGGSQLAGLLLVVAASMIVLGSQVRPSSSPPPSGDGGLGAG